MRRWLTFNNILSGKCWIVGSDYDMPLKSMVAGNLRRTQAFDAELRSADEIDKIADAFADAILGQPDSGKRRPKIDELVSRLVNHAEKNVLPQAEKIGHANALDILRESPRPIDLNDPADRAAALLRGRRRASDRLEIIKTSLKQNGNTLDSALTKYWLEPGEGNAKDKLARLRQIHTDMEKRRKAWEAAMRDFHAGKIKTRPAQPKLDFSSAMTAESKKDIREQARRAGTDAEIAVFQTKGYAKFVWITPNGAAACPDCQNRQSVVLNIEEWERLGRPGSGKTVCGANCYCTLIPAESGKANPDLLSRGSREAGPSTDSTTLTILNANRVATPAGIARKEGQTSAHAAKIPAALPSVPPAAPAPAAAPVPEVKPPPPPPTPKTAKEWVADLTEEERTGVNRFQGAHYGRIRAYQIGNVKPTDADYTYVKEAVDGLNKAVKKAPDWEGRAFRGLKRLSDADVKKFKIGGAVKLDAHSSFSASEDVAKRFAANTIVEGQRNVVMVADMKTGVDIRPIDDFEQEIIGRKGTRFVITKVEEKEVTVTLPGWTPETKRITYVHMTEAPSRKTIAQIKRNLR